MNWRKFLRLKEKPLKGEIGLDMAPVADGKPLPKNDHKCSECGNEKSDSYYGEERQGKWTYWCGKCYMIRFCGAMRSSPQALAKYYQIYGKSPEEVLKINT